MAIALTTLSLLLLIGRLSARRQGIMWQGQWVGADISKISKTGKLITIYLKWLYSPLNTRLLFS